MPTKIIHVISSLRRGGRERQLAAIMANTDLDNYPSKIIYFNESQDSYIDEYDLSHHIIKLGSKNFILRFIELHRLIKQRQPDVVFAWGNLESIFAILLKPFNRFVHINGSVRHGIRSKQFSHYFRTVVLHLSQYVVANSYAGLRANNLKKGFVLYNGVDVRFLLALGNKQVKRKELVDVSSDTCLLISVANLVPYKDYFTVLEALKRVKTRGVDFHYLILGNGPLKGDIEKYIEKCGLENNVTIVGHVENVHEYLKISDIFIHSSKGEGCSNAILEAMAAGLPVIATDTGGTSEIVNSNFGKVFEYKNPNQLVNHLQQLMPEKERLKDMGERAKREIENKFTIKKMMFNYYEIIDNIFP